VVELCCQASSTSKMDISGMEGMGMDSASSPMFRPYNQRLARGYWYIIAGFVGFLLLLRGIEYYQVWARSVVGGRTSNKTIRSDNDIL